METRGYEANRLMVEIVSDRTKPSEKAGFASLQYHSHGGTAFGVIHAGNHDSLLRSMAVSKLHINGEFRRLSTCWLGQRYT